MKPIVACPVPLRDASAKEQCKDARAAAPGAVAYLSGRVGFLFSVLWFALTGLLPLGAVSAADQPVAKTQQQTTPQQTADQEPAAAKSIPNKVCQTEQGQGPEMVIMPPGSFEMGDDNSDEDDEKPAHTVTIDYPFALGRCEVTVAEYRRYVEATGSDPGAEAGNGCYAFNQKTYEYEQVAGVTWQAQGFEGQETLEQHPALCISWDDAQLYITWLNEQAGFKETDPYRYRLPSEAEIEYALRSGNQDTYPWADASQCRYSNAADQGMPDWYTSKYAVAECPDGYPWVAPVGSFPPNPYGLFDLSGNVWEWTQDCWHDDYAGAPNNGDAWEGSTAGGDAKQSTVGDCDRRVLRGGSWGGRPQNLRSALRYGDTTVGRFDLVGFRLARTLGPLRSGL